MSRTRRPHPLALALALALPAAALADHPSPPRPTPAPGASCLGRWQGTGRGGSGLPWSIDMVVTAEEGARCGTIEYPSLGCGGYLVRCRRQGDVVTWTEVYTHNPGTCAPAGRIEGRCDADRMRWTWTGLEIVRSQLRRASLGPRTP
ncbi:MAG: hypothetical protein EPO40_01260 [Myxococcaceae bacterium]|nr:MAG: hypothetical protein EPO40_01260 [Myxococcaceae bacterium]